MMKWHSLCSSCSSMAAVNKIESHSKYVRHRPEQSLLYRTVQTYWPMFLREQARVGKTIPKFVKQEFDEFLKCGIPEFGVVRTYCFQCRYSGVVAFSCKRRGFCPSCCARRMNDEAAHLVDKVLPQITYRQWVISFPYKLRYQMAYNSKLTNKILSIFISVISSHLRRHAKKQGVPKSKIGSITFIQRFGSALNLNVHFHTLFADGVYYLDGEKYRFLRLAEPTQEELFVLAGKIKRKADRLIEKLGLCETDQTELDSSILGEVSNLSIQHRSGFGEREGRGLRRYGIKKIEVDVDSIDPHSANVEGFSLNARVWISATDQQKLEKLLRYMARGPIATDRLIECFPNTLLYKLKSGWKDGTSEIGFSHLDFIARLVAVIPPPRFNMIRYHGVFAPNFKDRDQIVRRPDAVKVPAIEGATDESVGPILAANAKRERLRWSQMLKRVFEIDVTVCPKCKGRLEQIAAIKDRVAAKALLENLGEETVFKPLLVPEARGPPQFDEYYQEFHESDF